MRPVWRRAVGTRSKIRMLSRRPLPFPSGPSIPERERTPVIPPGAKQQQRRCFDRTPAIPLSVMIARWRSRICRAAHPENPEWNRLRAVVVKIQLPPLHPSLDPAVQSAVSVAKLCQPGSSVDGVPFAPLPVFRVRPLATLEEMAYSDMPSLLLFFRPGASCWRGTVSLAC